MWSKANILSRRNNAYQNHEIEFHFVKNNQLHFYFTNDPAYDIIPYQKMSNSSKQLKIDFIKSTKCYQDDVIWLWGCRGKSNFYRPIKGSHHLTSFIGWRRHPTKNIKHYHTGMDFGAVANTKVYPICAGKVLFSGSYGGYGNTVILDHGIIFTEIKSTINLKPKGPVIKSAGGSGNKKSSPENQKLIRISLYAHLNKSAVKQGQWVSPSNIIGYVGSTGNSTGPHLHLEYRIGNEDISKGITTAVSKLKVMDPNLYFDKKYSKIGDD